MRIGKAAHVGEVTFEENLNVRKSHFLIERELYTPKLVHFVSVGHTTDSWLSLLSLSLFFPLSPAKAGEPLTLENR